MANVKFLRGLYADYSNLTPKDTDTLYITGASQDSYDSIYLGANLLGTSTPDAASIKFTPSTYPDDTTITEIDKQTTLLGLIKVLENRMTDIAGGSHSVLSVAGLTGEIKINNTAPTEEEFANFGNGDVYVLPSIDTKTLIFRTNIDAAGLFSPTQLVRNDGTEDVDVTYDDLLQIVDAGQVLDSIHLAKLKLRLGNSSQSEVGNAYSYASDGLVLMSDVFTYVKRIVSDVVTPDIISQINSHKTERNAHKLENIEKLSTDASNNITTIINSAIDPVGSDGTTSPEDYGISSGWNSISKYIDLETITDEITNSSNAEDVIEAMFKAFSKAIKGTIDVSTHYTDTQVASVAIEWEEIA